MTETARRVVLLARPGTACERLTVALQEAGADLVLTADPTSADAASVVAADPHAILVALEPSVEDALDRFDAVLADPAIMVIFDEAELAAQREGWDAARWVRHLGAKLNQHGDVLPPGTETEPDYSISEAGLAQFASEAETHAQAVPRDDRNHGVTPVAVAYVAPDDSDIQADPNDTSTNLIDAPPPPAETDAQDAPAASDSGATRQRFQQDLEELDRRIADITLTDTDSYGHGPRRGAVLVEGGMGGPDAVRQLLGGMPAGFPRPILVRLRLDGGRYDRLVRQMARATELPVVLAEHGQPAERGHVYFMPPTLGIAERGAKLVFVDTDGGSGAVLASLPAGDSAVVLLSGSDPQLVDAAMTHAWSGALVIGQSADGCYDAAASDALVARGAEAGSPVDLAKRLAERWPT